MAAEVAMVRRGVCVLSLTIVTGASAADIPSDPMFNARSLRCEFDRGHAASWNTHTHELVIKEGTLSDPPTPLVFDNIDLTEGTARFAGPTGPAM
jgi:hypothetical protein